MSIPSETTLTRVTAGIDWISGTLPEGVLDYQTWIGDCEWALMQIAKEGYVIEKRRNQGYEGFGFGNTFVGTNERGAFAQFTGEKAHYAYPFLEHPSVHISRLDLQVTTQMAVMDNTIGEKHYASANTYDQNLPQNRQRSIDRYTSKGGGYTLYIGSASSPQRLRVYNKQAQTEDIFYTRCWRYEMVYRNRVSDLLYRSVLSKGDTPEQFIVSNVVNATRERGVNILGLEHITPEPLDMPVKPPTDIERKLKWLATQVKPTIKKLSEAGYGDQAARAMGLWVPEES